MASFELPKHGEILDIGGSKMMSDVEQRLRELFPEPTCEINDAKSNITLPDELLYTDRGLEIWNEIIFTPEFYQTHDEIAIFDNHGEEVVSRSEDGVVLIDLGAGDTRKVEHLLAAFEKAGRKATYLALDISEASLTHNVGYLESQHADEGSVVSCAGLWGTFEDGLEWVQSIKSQRLFLSLGSVLCNDDWFVAVNKVKGWAGILRPDDMLLVGMDAHLTGQDDEKIWASYHTREDLYESFFVSGFEKANCLVGETWFRKEDWDVKAQLENPTRHRWYFRANHTFELGTTGRIIQEGEEFDWFDSHKYGEDNVKVMFEKAGLIADTTWQAPGSEFRQYLVKLRGVRGDADSAVSGVN